VQKRDCIQMVNPAEVIGHLILDIDS